MALFTRSKGFSFTVFRDEKRGQLSVDLWDQDGDHGAYIETGQQLLAEYATRSMQAMSKRPVPREIADVMDKFLRPFVPLSAQVPTLADASRTAYILSSLETWTELDRDELHLLSTAAWEGYKSNAAPDDGHERFRGGVLLAGLVRGHETQTEEKRMPSFDYLTRYVTMQPSYQRLLALEETFAKADLQAFFDLDDRAMEQYRWNNLRAWHIGVSASVLDEAGLLRR